MRFFVYLLALATGFMAAQSADAGKAAHANLGNAEAAADLIVSVASETEVSAPTYLNLIETLPFERQAIFVEAQSTAITPTVFRGDRARE